MPIAVKRRAFLFLVVLKLINYVYNIQFISLSLFRVTLINFLYSLFEQLVYFIRRCIVDYSKHILTIRFILLLFAYWAVTELLSFMFIILVRASL